MSVPEHFVSPLAVMFVVVDDADEALNSDSAEMGMLTCSASGDISALSVTPRPSF